LVLMRLLSGLLFWVNSNQSKNGLINASQARVRIAG
jgi:hypothetical protein